MRSSLQTELKNQDLKDQYVEKFHRLLEDNKRLQVEVTRLQMQIQTRKSQTSVDNRQIADLRDYCSAFDECSDKIEELAAWITREDQDKKIEIKENLSNPLEKELQVVHTLRKCANQRMQALDLLNSLNEQVQNSLIRRNEIQQSTIEFFYRQPQAPIRPRSPQLKRTQRSEADRKIIQNYEGKIVQQEQEIRRLTLEIQKIQHRLADLEKKNQRLLDERSDARAQVKDLQAKMQKLQSSRKQQIVEIFNRNTKEERKSQEILKKHIDTMTLKISELQSTIQNQNLTIRMLQAGEQKTSLSAFENQLKQTLKKQHEQALQKCLKQQRNKLKREQEQQILEIKETSRVQLSKIKKQLEQQKIKHQNDTSSADTKLRDALNKVQQLQNKIRNVTAVSHPVPNVIVPPSLFQEQLMPHLNHLIRLISL